MNSINALIVRLSVYTTRLKVALILPLVLTACGGGTTPTSPTPTPLAAPSLTDLTDQSFTVGVLKTITFTNSGGDVTASTGCAVDPDLPAGLSVAVATSAGKRTCQISGTPAAAAVGENTYTVTGTNTTDTNDTGTSRATVKITVVAVLAAPDLADAGERNLTIGIPATITFTNSGGNALNTCTVLPDTLPEGLSVDRTDDNSSCQISGTPLVLTTTATTFTVTGANAAGDDEATVNINVSLPETLNIISEGDLAPGNNIIISTFVNRSDTNPVNTSVEGMVVGASDKMNFIIDDQEGIITVTVTDTNQLAFFTTSFSAAGEAVLARDLSEHGGSKIIFELSSENWGDYGATDISDGMSMKIDHTSGDGSCDCEIPLDVSGLGENEWKTFAISLTQLTQHDTENLDLTTVRTGLVLIPNRDLQSPPGAGANGGTPLTFRVRNLRWELTKPDLQDFIEPQTLIATRAARISFVNQGSEGITACIAPAAPPLPAGLTLAASADGATCILSGTPSTTSPETAYTVTATNLAGDDDMPATIRLIVAPANPALVNVDQTQTLTRGLAIKPIVFLNNGASAKAMDGCTEMVGTELPDGLELEIVDQAEGAVRSCQITGTPTTGSMATSYTINAVGDNDTTSMANVMIAVVDLPEVPQSCLQFSSYTQQDVDDYPVTVSGYSKRLFLRGNHSDGTIDNDFLFRYKGDDTYQAAAVFDIAGAATGYDPATTTFRITSDEQAQATQFYVQTVAATTETDIETVALLTDGTGRMLAKSDGTGVNGVNSADLSNPVAYLFTVTLTEADPSANGIGVGTLKIEECVDDTAPTVSEVNIEAETTTATLTFTSDEAGTASIVVLAPNASAPTAANIERDTISTSTSPIAASTLEVVAGTNTISLTGLTFGTNYKVHFVVNDGNNTPEVISTEEFTTDNTLAAPDLVSIDALVVLEVRQVATIRFDNGGDAPDDDGCQVSGATTLPTSLELESSGGTCIITGTPIAGDAVSRSGGVAGEFATTTYTITARNTAPAGATGGGSDNTPATVTILIVAPQDTLPIVSEPTQNELRTLVVDQVYADIGADTTTDLSSAHIDVPINFSDTSLVTDCQSAPKLPAGLTVQPASNLASCIIVGMPSLARIPATYTITASNSQTAVSSGTIRLEVIATAPMAPMLTAPGAQTYKANTEITPLIIDNTGESITAGGDRNCTATGLPSGLMVKASADGQDCQIFGRPTTVAPAATVMVTATNSAGSGATTGFDITIIDPAPIITAVSVSTTTTEALLSFISDVAAEEVRVLVRPATENEPDVVTVQNTGIETNAAAGVAARITLTRLTANIAHRAYFVVTDFAGNATAVIASEEFTIVDPSRLAPAISAVNVSDITPTTATLTFTSSKAGTASIVVLAFDADTPTAADIAMDTISTSSFPIAASTLNVVAGANTVSLTGLTADTDYKVHFVVNDGALDSAVVSTDTFASGTILPVISAVGVSDVTATGATLNFTSSKAGTASIVVLAFDADTPTAADIAMDTISTSSSPIAADTLTVVMGTNTVSLTGLITDTAYKAHFVVNDGTNNSIVVSTDTFVFDTTPPVISAVEVSDITATGATLNFTSSKAGTASIVVLASGADTPTASEIEMGAISTSSSPIAASTLNVVAGANTVLLTGLTADTDYKAHFVVNDGTNNSAVVSTDTFVFDTTLPVISDVSVSDITATGAILNFTSSEAGTASIVVLASGADTPTAADIAMDTISTSSSPIAASTLNVVAGANTVSLTGLIANIAHKVYFVVTDFAGNDTAVIASEEFTIVDVISAVGVSDVTATGATLNFTSSEAGTASIVVLAFDADTPTAADIAMDTISTSSSPIAADTLTVVMGTNTVSLTGLITDTAYKAHFVVNDGTNNSIVVSTDTFVFDTILPVIIGAVSVSEVVGTSAKFSFTSSESGTASVLVLLDGSNVPDADAIKRDLTTVTQSVPANTLVKLTRTGLTVSTDYVAYIVVTDEAGNDSVVTSGSIISFSTKTALRLPMLQDIEGLIVLEIGVNYQSTPAGDELTPIEFINTTGVGPGGATVPACQLAAGDILPDGLTSRLNSNGDTCAIVGTPMRETDEATYTVIATTPDGSSQATVRIRIIAQQTDAPAAREAEQPRLRTLQRNSRYSQEIGAGIFNANLAVPLDPDKGTVTECSVSSPLPAGLTIEPGSQLNGCSIIGTPTGLSSPTTYTVTLSNSQGSGTGTIRIEVVYQAATADPELSGSYTFPVNEEKTVLIENTSGRVTAGVGSTCVVTSDNLPAGLEIEPSEDGTTCEISGTPTAITSSTDVTIEISTIGGGTVEETVSITVLGRPSLQNIVDLIVLETNVNYPSTTTPIEFVNIGVDPENTMDVASATVPACRLATAQMLPDGLTVQLNNGDTSCAITGTPTAITDEEATYTVIATNAEGFSEATVRIRVVAQQTAVPAARTEAVQPRPRLRTLVLDHVYFPSAAGGLGIHDNLVVPTLFSGGSQVTECTVLPALPEGLSIEPESDLKGCRIFGTPTKESRPMTYTVTPSNNQGSGTPGTIRIEVVYESDAIDPFLSGTYTVYNFEENTVRIDDNSGGRVTAGGFETCVSDDNLPGGLTITPSADGTTCVISGMPMGVTTADPVPVSLSFSTLSGATATSRVMIIVAERSP